MPFTPSHAVLALPFIRTPLVPAAIAIGSMTPDLPIFLRVTGLRYTATHDLLWLPATVALALGLLLLWRAVLRPAVRELSPRWIAERVPAQWDGTARAAVGESFALRVRPGRSASEEKSADAPSVAGTLVMVVSLAVVVVSHIAWDAFTHEGRAGASLIPALDAQWGPLLGYKWLQYGSSLLGLAIIAVWAGVWLRRRRPERTDRVVTTAFRVGVWVALPVLLAGAWFVGTALYGPIRPGFSVARMLYAVMPTACALWGFVVVAASVAIQLGRVRRAETAAGDVR